MFTDEPAAKPPSLSGVLVVRTDPGNHRLGAKSSLTNGEKWHKSRCNQLGRQLSEMELKRGEVKGGAAATTTLARALSSRCCYLCLGSLEPRGRLKWSRVNND